MKHIVFILLTALLVSCGGRQTTASQEAGDTVVFKYTTQLNIVRHEDYTEVEVKNPWKEGKILHSYLLVPDSIDPQDISLTSHHSPLTSTIVRTPLRRSVMFTTVHCAMLMSFGCEQSIAGVADLKYIKIPWIHEQVKAGRITDVGEGMSPVVEKIIDQRPDALFLSPFENSGGYGRLEEIGIPIIECAEYMEPSPLARAEWLRFYGMLFGCEQKADSLFAVVDSSYCALKGLFTVDSLQFTDEYSDGSKGLASKSSVNRKLLTVNKQKSVLLDKVTGSVWYVPGGRSTIGQMIQDAGGNYPWADDDHSGSVSLPFEAVLEKAGEADVWLFRYSSDHDITPDELLSEHHGYGQFKAFRSGEIYGCDVERSLFYEESPFRPDWLLGDYIHILHPDIPNLPPLRYYKKVKVNSE